ncbi:MAG: glycosyltransferase family A protein [Candidatus Bathyarchaeia archaeon]
MASESLGAVGSGPPRILAIICAKDERPYLAKCLDALLAQSAPGLSIIVVDDGSIDGTYDLARSYANRHEAIRVLRRPRAKGGKARAHGIPIAEAFNYAVASVDLRGFDYLAKIDADVVLSDGYLEELLRAFESDPRLGLAAGQTINEPTGDPRGGNRVFRMACWLEASWGGRMPEVPAEDTYTALRAMLKGWRVRLIPRAECLHLRPNRLKPFGRKLAEAFWRGAACRMLGYHPLLFLGRLALSALRPPGPLGALAGLGGWAYAKAMGYEAEPELRAFVRRIQARRVAEAAALGPAGLLKRYRVGAGSKESRGT